MADRAAWAVAAAVVVLGLLGGGAGWVNGDAAAYAAQGWAGDLGQRTIHAGYVAWAAGLAVPAGAGLPRWLDATSAVAAGALVLAAAEIAARRGHPGWVAAAALAPVVLPWASVAEVDLPWLALAAWAVVVPARWAAVLFGLAVAVSPAALLAGPWVAHERKAWREVAAGAVIAVAVLTVAGGGDWWVGSRGVLRTAVGWTAGDTAAGLARSVPWWAVPLAARGWRSLAPLPWLLPVLAIPPDAHPGLAPAVVVAVAAAAGWGGGRRLRAALAVLLVAGAADGWLDRARVLERVAREDRVIREVVAELGPEDGLIAPWTWGVRASVIATGDPYGLAWRKPDRPIRPPGPLCAGALRRVAVLPPDPEVRWLPGDAAEVTGLPGCAGDRLPP